MLIVDTGVLLAAVDRADPDHEKCAALVRAARRPLVTTPFVVAETAYLIQRQLGPSAEVRFFQSIVNGEITVEVLTSADLARVAELIETYADLPLGGADASVIALAERFDEERIATLDHRHFSVVIPAHLPGFELVP